MFISQILVVSKFTIILFYLFVVFVYLSFDVLHIDKHVFVKLTCFVNLLYMFSDCYQGCILNFLNVFICLCVSRLHVTYCMIFSNKHINLFVCVFVFCYEPPFFFVFCQNFLFICLFLVLFYIFGNCPGCFVKTFN